MKEYHRLFLEVLSRGNLRQTRAGQAMSCFGAQIRLQLSQGFPIVTTKKVFFNTVVEELRGFLRGEQDASKMGSDIWIKDAKRWSGNTDMGRIYGVQWRQWKGPQGEVDQLRQVIERLKTDPTDRRLLVTAWNPGETHLMCLPPCHYAFQFYVENGKYLSCMFHMRSVDLFLGLPYDIASYALLTSIVANECGYTPWELIGTFGDTHIYMNHMQQVTKLLDRKPYSLPKLILTGNIDKFHAELNNYKHYPAILAPLNVRT